MLQWISRKTWLHISNRKQFCVYISGMFEKLFCVFVVFLLLKLPQKTEKHFCRMILNKHACTAVVTVWRWWLKIWLFRFCGLCYGKQWKGNLRLKVHWRGKLSVMWTKQKFNDLYQMRFNLDDVVVGHFQKNWDAHLTVFLVDFVKSELKNKRTSRKTEKIPSGVA